MTSTDRSSRASSALHRAIETGRYKSLEYLLKLNLNPNVRDVTGLTPLMHCCAVQNEPLALWLLRVLLRSGADPSLTDRTGANLLGQAIKHGRYRMVNLLLESNDIDLHHRDNNGNTVLHYLAQKNERLCRKVVEAVQRFHVNVDVPNEEGMTPLMFACRHGNVVLARLLANDCNASLSSRDPLYHRNALEWLEFFRGRSLTDEENPFNDLTRAPSQGFASHHHLIQTPAPFVRVHHQRPHGISTSQTSLISDSTSCFDESQTSDAGILPALTSVTINEPQFIISNSRRLFPDLDSVISSDLQKVSRQRERAYSGTSRRPWNHMLRDIYSMYSTQISVSFRPGVERSLRLNFDHIDSEDEAERLGPPSRSSSVCDKSFISASGINSGTDSTQASFNKARRRTRVPGNSDVNGSTLSGETSRSNDTAITGRERTPRKMKS